MITQVNKAIDIFEAKYPHAQALFIFDNAPSHTKMPDDALNADGMNVKPGGKQPVMRATMYGGKFQEMVLENGTPKGLKKVLEERGVCTDKMKREDMIAKLKTYEDFNNNKIILCEVVEVEVPV